MKAILKDRDSLIPEKLSFGVLSCGGTGLEIATNTVAFATEFYPFATKISGEVANFHLRSFETKGLAVAALLLFLLKSMKK